MKQHHLITLALLVAILLLSIKLVQQFRTLHLSARSITFTCAVGVQDNIGQVCVKGDPGAQVRISIAYCNHQSVNSPAMTSQVPGTNEYRWIWLVQQPISCAGKEASAQAWAQWAHGTPAWAKAAFSIAIPT